MLTAGYEFYRGTYHGDKITAAEWPVLSRDAAACLEELTLGRTAADLAPELLERCQMALWSGYIELPGVHRGYERQHDGR